jgi:acetyl-CoA C-acetyltransferase
MKLGDIVCIGAARTPAGSFGGSLKDMAAYDLGSVAIKAALERAGVAGDKVDEVFFGNCRQAGVRTNPARTASLRGGVPFSVTASTMNMACPSGMKSSILAAQSLLLNDAKIALAGGMESMSRIPFFILDARWEPFRMGDKKIVDGWNDNIDPMTGQGMGQTAENLVEKYGLTRKDQDHFANESHAKAANAQDAGWFDEEIAPVAVPARKKAAAFLFDKDETIRRGSSMEKLGKLRAAFKEGGSVTAGNACGMSDGASALVFTTRKVASDLGVKPLFSVQGYASAAVENHLMGEGPGVSIPRALAMSGMSLADMDLVEINEAFAAQVLSNVRQLDLHTDKLNVSGGAIALGHPVGSSGSRILVTLYYALKRMGKELGVAGICGGTGVTCAMVIKRES